jgi:hypothetical protein
MDKTGGALIVPNDKMGHWAALVEWESGGLNDIPDKNLCEFLSEIMVELQNRGYEMSCEEYVIYGSPNCSSNDKTINFARSA